MVPPLELVRLAVLLQLLKPEYMRGVRQHLRRVQRTRRRKSSRLLDLSSTVFWIK
jgi:hypothetical protein